MSTPKILVVDDDEGSRDLLTEVLGANGYGASAVADGKAAREVLDSDDDFRIVIADLRIQEESGLDLLRDLRRHTPGYCVVLMSSFMSDAERRVAQDLGVDALLEKPFRLSDLLQLVLELTGKSSLGVSS
jgi:DNA-binding response OmpR family regulator